MPPHENILNLLIYFFTVSSNVFIFTEGLSVMTCCVLMLTERRIVALHAANRVQPCPDRLLPSPGERKKCKSFPLFLCLSSLPVSQLYMFNELASFLSVFIPSTPSLPLHAHTRFFLFLFFFFIQCSRRD